MNYKRYFLLEPNLKKAYGHVIEFPFALGTYLKKQGKEVYVICNKNIDKSLLATLDNTYPLISQGCFDDLDDDGSYFSKDFNKINLEFKLRENDLLITLTSYTNQILGIAKYLKQNPKKSSTFCLWLHQIYPPTEVFGETQSDTFTENIHNKLNQAFTQIESFNNVFIFTTPSEDFRETIEKLSNRTIKTLPLPYKNAKLTNEKSIAKPITFGFLGDGRYEKGLILILECLEKYKDTQNQYILEDIYPRGYSKSDLNKINKLENSIREKMDNVTFIKEPLSNDKYKRILKNIDVFLMPYHPDSYDKRISGIFVEATSRGIPSIVSSGTWISKEVEEFHNGVVFNYKSGFEGLNLAIAGFILNKEAIKQNATKASKRYNKIHTPKNFINTLLKSLN